MAHIYSSILSLIKPEHIETGAAVISESQQKVAAAADMILPSLLARMLKNGDSPEMEDVLRDGKKIKAWENIDRVWAGSGVDEHINFGERMENRIMGSNSQKFTGAVAHKTGMRAGDADRLTNWVAATIGAWFSQQVAGGASYKDLLGHLAGEKAELAALIPSDVLGELGIGNLLHVDHPAAAPKTAPVSCHAPAAAAAPKVAPQPLKKEPISVHTPERRKSSLAWLWWLLGLILLALVIMWLVRSCSGKKMAVGAPAAVTTVVKDSITIKHAMPKFEGVPMVLPDGTHVTMYKGSLEESVRAYLDSDKFRNANDAQLRSVWFEFTDIDFEHNKSTELMKGSPERLRALVEILKSYPGVHIKVGSFGDRTGNRAANYQISEKRALSIMEVLKASGFPAANLSHEGFGKEFAKAAASAPDAERAPDRDVAMCFTRGGKAAATAAQSGATAATPATAPAKGAAQAAGQAVQKAAQSAGQAVQKGAQTVKQGAQQAGQAAQQAGQAVQKGAQQAGQAVKQAATAVEKKAEQVVEKAMPATAPAKK